MEKIRIVGRAILSCLHSMIHWVFPLGGNGQPGEGPAAHHGIMRILIFISGLLINLIGWQAFRICHDPSLLLGGLTLGGGLIICGLFSIRSPFHGWVGAGVLALLGFFRSVSAVADLPQMLKGGQKQPDVVFRLGVALICLVLIIRVYRALKAEQAKKQLAELERGNPS
jgi:hypothetical protein